MTAGAPHNYRVQAISYSGLGERSDFVKVFPLRKAANKPRRRARPPISGTTQVGETLTADTSGIVDADRLENGHPELSVGDKQRPHHRRRLRLPVAGRRRRNRGRYGVDLRPGR